MTAISVEFDGFAYTREALHAAAYRIIGTVSCQIEKKETNYVCLLTPVATDVDPNALRRRFLDLVTDECVREQLHTKTDGYRNLILSLAFGALASETAKQP